MDSKCSTTRQSDSLNNSLASPFFNSSLTLYFCCLTENSWLPLSLTSQTRLRGGAGSVGVEHKQTIYPQIGSSQIESQESTESHRIAVDDQQRKEQKEESTAITSSPGTTPHGAPLSAPLSLLRRTAPAPHQLRDETNENSPNFCSIWHVQAVTRNHGHVPSKVLQPILELSSETIDDLVEPVLVEHEVLFEGLHLCREGGGCCSCGRHDGGEEC